MVERARGLLGVLRERQRSLTQALDAAADADVVSTLEAEGAGWPANWRRPRRPRLIWPRIRTIAPDRRPDRREVEAHLEEWGGGERLRQAEEAVTVARGQLDSLGRALERDRQSLGQLSERLVTAERRVADFEHEDHELGERLAQTEQSRHRLQAAVAETEAAHRRPSDGWRRLKRCLRQAEQEFHRVGGPCRCSGEGVRRGPGAAGAELLAGVEGVVGTLLDLVEVDQGWEMPSRPPQGHGGRGGGLGKRPAQAALSRLRRGGATGAVLALTDAAPAEGARRAPPGTESIVTMCAPLGRPRPPRVSGRPRPPSVRSCCVLSSWSEAIDWRSARPDLVVVTREGDRFSSTGWRVRADGGVVTATVVEEARARSEQDAATSDAARNAPPPLRPWR